MKNIKQFMIPFENQPNHQNLEILRENHDNHENHEVPYAYEML